VLKNIANEAETVSVFYFSFISPCATGFMDRKNYCTVSTKQSSKTRLNVVAIEIKPVGLYLSIQNMWRTLAKS